MLFQDFLSGALATLLLGGAGNHLCILKEGIMGNIHVKFCEISTGGSGGDVV